MELCGESKIIDDYVLTGTLLKEVVVNGIRDKKGEKTFTRKVDIDLVNIVTKLIYKKWDIGSIFENNRKKGGRLPEKSKSNYYQSYYLTISGFERYQFATPERIVVGKCKEIYYTPDHYHTFVLITAHYDVSLGAKEKYKTYLNLVGKIC